MSEDTRLWFVYGSLKPGELGYRRIESCIAKSFPGQLDGWRLALRDGLPVVTKQSDSTVNGFVLEAKPDQLDALDLSIRSFEDPNTYVESVATVTTPDNEPLQVRVNAAKHPNKSPLEPVASGAWSVSDDLLFRHALPVLYQQAHQPERVYPDSDEAAFWESYLPLMGTLLNLWTVFERYVAFAQPALQNQSADDVGDKSGLTMADHYLALHGSDLGSQLIEHVRTLPTERVYRADRVRRAVRANVPWELWYTVRNNAAHRGKSAIRDFRIVHDAALGLSEALIALLRLEVPVLNKHYESLGIPHHLA